MSIMHQTNHSYSLHHNVTGYACGVLKYSGPSRISNNINLHFYLIVVLFNVQRNADSTFDKSQLHHNVTSHHNVSQSRYSVDRQHKVFWVIENCL